MHAAGAGTPRPCRGQSPPHPSAVCRAMPSSCRRRPCGGRARRAGAVRAAPSAAAAAAARRARCRPRSGRAACRSGHPPCSLPAARPGARPRRTRPPSARCCADRRGHPAARPRTPPRDTAACRARLPFRAPAHRSLLRPAHRSDVLPSFSPPRAARQTPRPRSVCSFVPQSRADARRAPRSRRARPAQADRC